MDILRKLNQKVRARIIIEAYKDFIKENSEVADIGCGKGYVGYLIKKHFNCQVDGFDINNFLEYDIGFNKIENFKINIKDKTYDIAMLNDVLHHIDLKDQEKIIKEAKRISKKVLIIETKPGF